MSVKRATFLAAACAALLAPAAFAAAESPAAYPSRSVRVLVGYPPGGASDIVGRLIANELANLDKQAFVIENKPGVGGMLAMSQLARMPADGYAIGLGVSDPLADFEPVGMVAKAPMVLLASPSAGYDNVAALIKDAKAHPGHVMFASGAQAFELALKLFNSKAGVDITTVSYAGGAQASIDVMSGRAQIMVDTIGAQQGNIKAGKLKPLAVLDSVRSPTLPNVPTMAEAGVPGYEALGWTSLVVPKGTPEPIVRKLNQQLQQVLAMPQVKDKLLSIGFEPWPGTTQFMQETVASEYAKWGDVVRASGMQPQ
jgi:tripartite-type tricarboxylate transporter receptor subunit TctC